MKTILCILAAAFLIMMLPNRCFAMLDIEQVTKDRAKALGMEIRATAAGPNLVRVELAFEPRGELKHFTRVDLEMRDGEKLLISSTLKEEQTKPGKIIVSFAADRGKLDQMTLRVVELTECARAATPLIPTHAKLDQ